MTAREKAKAAYKEIYGQDVEMGGRKAGERNPGLEIVTIIERALLDTIESCAKVVDRYVMDMNASADMEQEDGNNEEAHMFFHDQHEMEAIAAEIRKLGAE